MNNGNDPTLSGIVIGAALTLVATSIADELRAWRVRARERTAIKISIADELRDIEATISNMNQVWESAQLFHPNYVSDLQAGTSAYDALRPRLFLIKDKNLRKEITDFYKKLKDTARKTEGKIGTLAETQDAKTEQASFNSSFQSLCNEAKNLREKLE